MKSMFFRKLQASEQTYKTEHTAGHHLHVMPDEEPRELDGISVGAVSNTFVLLIPTKLESSRWACHLPQLSEDIRVDIRQSMWYHNDAYPAHSAQRITTVRNIMPCTFLRLNAYRRSSLGNIKEPPTTLEDMKGRSEDAVSVYDTPGDARVQPKDLTVQKLQASQWKENSVKENCVIPNQGYAITYGFNSRLHGIYVSAKKCVERKAAAEQNRFRANFKILRSLLEPPSPAPLASGCHLAAAAATIDAMTLFRVYVNSSAAGVIRRGVEEGLLTEDLYKACSKKTSPHSPGVISETRGKPESARPDSKPNQDLPKFQTITLPLQHLTGHIDISMRLNISRSILLLRYTHLLITLGFFVGTIVPFGDSLVYTVHVKLGEHFNHWRPRDLVLHHYRCATGSRASGNFPKKKTRRKNRKALVVQGYAIREKGKALFSFAVGVVWYAVAVFLHNALHCLPSAITVAALFHNSFADAEVRDEFLGTAKHQIYQHLMCMRGTMAFLSRDYAEMCDFYDYARGNALHAARLYTGDMSEPRAGPQPEWFPGHRTILRRRVPGWCAAVPASQNQRYIAHSKQLDIICTISDMSRNCDQRIVADESSFLKKCYEDKRTTRCFSDKFCGPYEPHFKHNGVFNNDGSSCHYALWVRNFLNRRFSGKWISHGGPIAWPQRSPDLNPSDFFVWGYYKELIYSPGCHSLEDLTSKLQDAEENIKTIDCLEIVWDLF
ncbi:hypothetical protein PR048_011597 [Dryococelus australis]|uniref:Uncharacterized protein n=1 Tax=Dryococelus australis TaxID=614101 RepID=A0ABQ9HMJ9_9NEOP|nr:hypothetical protein PR048_011597 [Dryococelus australis]